ncbi:MAG: hypothetical protein LBG30_01610 [Odoribacteraceae bacterium]|jgi:hypothetical protein|nr:hypothetical protein [Odoribacteraceae bacterium]
MEKQLTIRGVSDSHIPRPAEKRSQTSASRLPTPRCATLFLIAGYSKNDRVRAVSEDETGRLALVSLSLSTPSSPTRADAPETENDNKVAGIDVLLFAKSNDRLYYRSSAVGAGITDINPPR